ncbi:Glycosyl transferase [Croceitalea dokdonensis DOKDO 023]|uniref:Glycosyl transferase n=2 Tax=Croceitalea TaxID=574891 RepID=A0A0P7ARG3_9FLAO|nr:Glycosyl transferase [Croceitalea dokdonensis DOKDO 023]
MDKKLDCDFYFGDTLDSPIKKMDYSNLSGFKKEFNTFSFFNTSFKWSNNLLNLAFKPYSVYILTGEPNVLSNWWITIFARFLNKKVFFWTHGIKTKNKQRFWWFERIFYLLPNKILLYGNAAKKNMLELGYPGHKLVVIYNSLNHEKQLKIRKRLMPTTIYIDYFGNNHPTLVYVGRLLKAKKLDQLIMAVALLNNQGHHCNLALIGPKVDVNNIESFLTKQKLSDKVWIYGACYEEEKLGELFYNAAVCVTPGYIGLTAIHSLTYGTPSLTHDNLDEHSPEYEVIVPNKTGGFFKQDDINDLAGTIEYWIGLDADERKNNRTACYGIIDTYWNPSNQVKILESIINT